LDEGLGDDVYKSPRAAVHARESEPVNMRTISRDELHRVVEQLPDDRLAAAAELLEALTLHDERVALWRQNLGPTEESEIAASLRHAYKAEERVSDEQVAAWIDSDANPDPAPQPSLCCAAPLDLGLVA